ncbi:MAG TPA: hypothetical protein VEF06_13270 [Bryobacteraceae bacterium]|nr:hypothetical protein [Bryobacteraceae bacterium]
MFCLEQQGDFRREYREAAGSRLDGIVLRAREAAVAPVDPARTIAFAEENIEAGIHRPGPQLVHGFLNVFAGRPGQFPAFDDPGEGETAQMALERELILAEDEDFDIRVGTGNGVQEQIKSPAAGDAPGRDKSLHVPCDLEGRSEVHKLSG